MLIIYHLFSFGFIYLFHSEYLVLDFYNAMRGVLLTGVAYSVFGTNPLVVRVVVPNIESFKYQESHHVNLIQHDKHSSTYNSFPLEQTDILDT